MFLSGCVAQWQLYDEFLLSIMNAMPSWIDNCDSLGDHIDIVGVVWIADTVRI